MFKEPLNVALSDLTRRRLVTGWTQCSWRFFPTSLNLGFCEKSKLDREELTKNLSS